MKIAEKKTLKNFRQFQKTVSTARRLLNLLWQTDKWLFIGNAVSVSVPAVLPFVNAFIYKLIIDLAVAAASGSPFQITHLYSLLIIRVITLFIQDSAFSAQNYFEMLLWTKFPVHLYQSVLSKLSDLDMEYFEDSSFKDKLEKVREAYAWRPINMLSFLFYGWQNLLQFSVALAAIATLNWLLIILFLLVAIPTFINQTNYAKISWGVWQQNSPYRKKFWYLSDLIQTGTSVKEIKIFGVANRFLAELRRLYYKFVKDNTEIAGKQLRTNVFLNLFSTGVYISIEIFIILSAIVKKISIGDIGYFTTVLINFQNAVNGLFRNASSLFDSGLYVQEVFELLDTPPKIVTPRQGIKVNIHRPPAIEFRNISFSYPGSPQLVLDHFSLTIHPGQKIALVGENGAGKTTLIKLLARFYDADEGEILIDGTNLKQLDLPTWYKTLGILFQDFVRYEYPLKDNIFFGQIHRPENIHAIIQAAKLSGVDTIASRLPKGYNQMLGKTFAGGVDLSAGQWQKVALARAFFRDAPILVLDEPTASIDAKSEAKIFNQVENLPANKTVIIISHRFSTVRNADKIYLIDKGKIKEEGNHEQLMRRNGIYASLFNLQAKRYK